MINLIPVWAPFTQSSSQKIHEHYIKTMLYEAMWNEACEHLKFPITSNTDIIAMGNCQVQVIAAARAACNTGYWHFLQQETLGGGDMPYNNKAKNHSNLKEWNLYVLPSTCHSTQTNPSVKKHWSSRQVPTFGINLIDWICRVGRSNTKVN